MSITGFFFLLLLVPSAWFGEYKLGYLTGNRISNFQFQRNAASPFVAVEKVIQQGLLKGNTIKIIYRDDKFDRRLSMGYAMELYENPGVDGFIGVGSSVDVLTHSDDGSIGQGAISTGHRQSPTDFLTYNDGLLNSSSLPICLVLSQTGYLMAYWNLPVLSQAATDPALQDKSIYKTLIRLVPPFNKAGNVMTELAQYYKWKRVMIISRETGLCSYSSQSIFSHLSRMEVIIPAWITFPEPFSDIKEETMDDILNTILYKSRIVVFCGSAAEKEFFLVKLHQANLTTPDYVYIFPPYRPLDLPIEPWTDNSNPNKDILLEASRAVLQFSLFSLDEEEVEAFKDAHVIKMAEYWNYNMTAENKVTSNYATFLHDSTYLYALTLNKTLEAGQDPRNGTLFVETAKKMVFKGVSGLVAFDENGDRQPTCSLYYVKPDGNKFVLWAEAILSNPPGQRMEIKEDIIWRTEDGSVPRDTPECGFTGELCIEPEADTKILILTVVFVVLLAILGIICIVLYIRKIIMNQNIRQLLWRVNFSDISFVDMNKFQRSLASLRFGMTGSSSRLSRRGSSVGGSTSLTSTLDNFESGQIFTKVALYKGRLSSVKFVHAVNLRSREQDELSVMCQLKHDNVNPFIGACVDPKNPCTLTMYCEKGSLQDILENDNIQLDSIFKESLIFDLINGMLYLHNSALRSHGNLKSSNCVIDSRWVLKVTDFYPTGVVPKRNDNAGEYEIYRAKLWTAPEILRAHAHVCRGSPPGDVFSFSIILQEILYRALPYFMEDYSPREIVELVKSVRTTPFRPECPLRAEIKSDFIRLMKQCWDETPSARPPFAEIRKTLEKISERGRISIMDRIIQKLESYSSNLEDIVRDRTLALREEKAKTDSLLYQMLPSIVADKLKQGEYVSPKLYEEATVYFSDIVGFMEMAAESSPMEVVVLLNDLYEMLDNLSATFDVYKVETIGDSYMVVSGIPVKNGSRHVAEVADMSLRVLESAQTFVIRHRRGEIVQLRVGFHTGACCAGVVGLAMPRYCLFGDTVNTASRMESNGLALKIHISEQTYNALSKFKDYQMTKRGQIAIKGKGMLTTYWLDGKEGLDDKGKDHQIKTNLT
ncbi:atrial natriuretic peptide receptor 1-like [Liolophura sinensis]|uniref:atrial natriuretic peptide receptor 1-like n=1 Tax=Liolophura sinensis TaxID=3198878 RepID=UPI0031597FAD